MTGNISVRKVQSILGELGHEISIGHCHELLSRLQGYKSHNHNKEKTSSLPKAGEYSVKIKANVENGYENTEIEIKKYLTIAAASRIEAEELVEKMLEDEDFCDTVREDDWEVIYNTANMKVEKTGNKLGTILF